MKRYLPLFVFAFSPILFSSVTAHADAAAGKASYDQRCASCHGITGAGDGPVAAAMPPGTIRNLATGPFKFATDEAKLRELLQKGGAALGLNPLMPPVAGASDEEMTALVKYVLSLRK
jgi:mono/diheme cytochrome c family protein